VPNWVYTSNALHSVDISNNSLTSFGIDGSAPLSALDLGNVRVLNISFNPITGTIPSVLGNSTILNALNVSNTAVGKH